MPNAKLHTLKFPLPTPKACQLQTNEALSVSQDGGPLLVRETKRMPTALGDQGIDSNFFTRAPFCVASYPKHRVALAVCLIGLG